MLPSVTSQTTDEMTRAYNYRTAVHWQRPFKHQLLVYAIQIIRVHTKRVNWQQLTTALSHEIAPKIATFSISRDFCIFCSILDFHYFLRRFVCYFFLSKMSTATGKKLSQLLRA